MDSTCNRNSRIELCIYGKRHNCIPRKCWYTFCISARDWPRTRFLQEWFSSERQMGMVRRYPTRHLCAWQLCKYRFVPSILNSLYQVLMCFRCRRGLRANWCRLSLRKCQPRRSGSRLWVDLALLFEPVHHLQCVSRRLHDSWRSLHTSMGR